MAKRVSVTMMYDCHLYHPLEGYTVDELVRKWFEHNAVPQPAIVGDQEIDDLGPAFLCPTIVLKDDKEVRRVGGMVFPGQPNTVEQLDKWRQAQLDDPDIPRLLKKGRSKRPVKEKRDEL